MRNTLLTILGITLLCGCQSLVKSDKIISVTTWGVGLRATASSPTSGTALPDVWLGVTRQTVTMIPTSTNNIYAPRFGVAYTGKQNAYNPIATDAEESVFSGDVMIGTNATGGAIIPKLGPPSAKK